MRINVKEELLYELMWINNYSANVIIIVILNVSAIFTALIW